MDQVSVGQVIIGGLIAFTIFKVVHSVVANLVLSPLRAIPGPLPAKLTSRWLGAISLAGHRASYLHALHQRYGDVVRVGPREVSFASAAAARDIYIGVDVDLADDDDANANSSAAALRTLHTLADEQRDSIWRTRRSNNTAGAGVVTVTKTFPKSPMYDTIGKRNVFRMHDEHEHRQRLKRVGHAFSPTLMPDVEHVIHELTADLLRAMERHRGRPVNVLHRFRMLAFDVIGRLFLGTHFEALKGEEPPAFIRQMDTAIPAWYIHRHYRLLHDFLISLPIKSVREFLGAGSGIYTWAAKCLADYIARNGRDSKRRLPLTRLLAGNAAAGLPPLPDDAVVAEITLMLFAGSDSTGITLAYLFYELARHPEWLARLRAELAAAATAASSSSPSSFLAPSHPAGGVPAEEARASDPAHDDHGWGRGAGKYDGDTGGASGTVGDGGGGGGKAEHLPHAVLQHLPVLNAVIWETLRMHPIIPALLSRAAPKGGAPVAGHFMPAGTLVAVPPYTLQRQAHVFPDPDAWRPERWIAPSPPPAAASASSPAVQAAHGSDTILASAPLANGGASAGGNSLETLPRYSRGSDKPSGAGTAGGGSGGGDDSVGGGGGHLIDGASGATEAMRAHMLVFSRGPRTCLGRAIAMMELRAATAAVARRFAAVRLASAQTVDDMQMTDNFVVNPKGHKCMLVFD